MRVNLHRIEKEMEKRLWNKAVLAKACGMSRQGVYNIFKTGSATLKTIGKIAQALDINPKSLLLIR